MKWVKGEPPKNGAVHLVKFAGGVVASVRYRKGKEYYEPQLAVKDWRCECCGRFVAPTEYAIDWE